MGRKNTRSGFTITELLVATGLVSIFFLIGSSVITQLFAFQKDVDRRLMDNFSVVSFHRVLNTDLEGSYWSRYGAFSCASSNDLLGTMSTESVTLGSANGFIEFVTADFSTTVGIVPNTETIAVANMRNLAVGDYVLLSLSVDGNTASLFKVLTVDRTRNRITLDSSSLTVPGSNCSFSLTAKALPDFFGASTKSNVLLTRVRVIQYAIRSGDLTRRVLPNSSGSEKIVDGMRSMKITSAWSTSSDHRDSNKQYGQMKFNVLLESDQATLMGGKATSRESQNLESQYTLGSFQYMNRFTSTGAPSATAKFPTCAVGYGYRPGALKIDPAFDGLTDTVPVSITGYVSEDVDSASIDVSFAPEAGASISCWKHDPDEGTYPKNGATIKARGASGAITLNRFATGFQVYTCAVKGSVGVSASMSYFSNEINQVKTIICSADLIDAPTRYKFQGAIPKCNKDWATWDMGSDIVNPDNTLSIGKFGVDMAKSCQWQGQGLGTSVDDGVADNCYAWSHWGKDLKRIYLRPYKQQVYDKTNSTKVFDSRGAFIDCD